jgi:protein ImuB
VDRVSRFACVLVEHFETAAHERCEPRLRERPLAVVRGTSPATRVVEANREARAHGVVPGMTHAEAQARCPALVTRNASEERVAAARQALLEAALGVSPRLEDGGTGIVYVDIGGLDRLIGDARAVARQLFRGARAVGLSAAIGIAGTRTAARVAARVGSRGTIVPPGDERAWLRGVPLAGLELSPSVAESLARWGVTTCAELADLPHDGLAMRLGREGLRARDMALGIDREPFRPYEPPRFWEEAQGVEWEISSWEGLAPVLTAVLERLTERLGAAHVCADRLELRLELASGGHDVRLVSLGYPLRQVKPMLSLIALEIEARPPGAAVTRVAISAGTVRAEPGQGALWHPPSPAFRDLAATLARLAVLVGRGNVGSPALADSHRPDAVVIEKFCPPLDERVLPEPRGSADAPGGSADAPGGSADAPGRSADAPGEDAAVRLGFRRLRPPRVVDVQTDGEVPVRLRFKNSSDPAVAREITVTVGPWRTSGDWWDTHAWARDEWDVVLGDGLLGRLVHDRIAGEWYLDGAYD